MPFQKGYTPWNKGTSAPQIAAALRGKKMPWVSKQNSERLGELHPLWGKKRTDIEAERNNKWKGDQVGYYALHRWIQRQLGQPSECVDCLSDIEKRYEWANISGDYKRDLSDWKRLCRSCHIKFDKSMGRWGHSGARATGGVRF